MADESEYPERDEELRDILKRKPGTEAATDTSGRYRVVGAKDRRTYANWLTAIEAHYVCHRHETPELEADSWTVSLAGAVEDSVEISMAEIVEDYPTVAVAHTMECAGNGRAYFDPEAGSVMWEYNAAGTAFWTGTPVRSILEAYGGSLNPDMWVTAVGGDRPEENDVFARSIPMAKMLEDCILAYEMNGQPLPWEHGHPVRLLVPGWYGVNSVKWLRELRVMDAMVFGPEWEDREGYDYTEWQQQGYRIRPQDTEPTPHRTIDEFDTWEQWASGAVEHPYTYDQNVKSVIGFPDDGDTVAPREDGMIEVLGVAWAGDDAVDRIEISTDDGETWTDAEFFGPEYRNAWRLFRYPWNADPGSYTLVSRATDEHGRRQPARISRPDEEWDALDDAYPWNERGYAANAYLPHAVDVEVVPPE